MNVLKRFVQDDSGQGLAEYGFAIGLVAICIFAALLLLKDNLMAVLQNISNDLGGSGAGG